ncbi:hypothetical protein K443DRAFT_682677 [Laccaria amethystina LaAM-08-1]|uniref:Uncharacterized protein n=1 Tax=Laccaria amethystina LaAM-08-1 TaxID=1095629 RepID=A0A0C9XIB1_9AGAR|nr:hypothetical protein K443DRAFT_682677 [Laccaria amethystina LaAM-08-1]
MAYGEHRPIIGKRLIVIERTFKLQSYSVLGSRASAIALRVDKGKERSLHAIYVC